MLEHSHVLGGSTAAKRINCAGSYQLEQQVPEPPTSEFAERGSMLHSAVELILINDPANLKACEPLFNELEGQDLGYKGHEITRELIDDKLRPAMQAWFDVSEKYQFDDWFIEQRVSLEAVIKGAFGTADILAKDKANRLHCLDWKFGDGVPVPVKGNYGAGFYAGAALYDPDPELVEFTEEVSGVVLHIVQPRSGSAENPLQTWETSVDWVETLIDLAVDAIDKAVKPNPPTKAGSWCRWCRAKMICPEYEQLAGEALSSEPAGMTSIELAEAMRKADLLTAWINDVYERALNEMERGVAVPGYKLVQKQARRQWVDAKQVEQRLRKARVKVGDIFKRTMISPAQLEKKFPKVYSKLQDDLVQSHSSGLTVVKDTDKRPAVTGSMALLANALPEREQ